MLNYSLIRNYYWFTNIKAHSLCLICLISIYFSVNKAFFYKHPAVLSLQNTGLITATVASSTGKLKQFSLFGYTSSYATIRLEGIGLLQETTANNKGYFEFMRFLAPENIAEFCFLNIDTENRTSPPLCITPPTNSNEGKYGPFLLPPTISVAKGENKAGTTNEVNGKTIPGTNVDINTFNQNSSSIFSFTLIPKVFAVSDTKVLTANATGDGTYTINLLTNNAGTLRLFSQSNYLNQKTPKSNTLSINVLAWWNAWLNSLLNALNNLLNINWLIIAELFTAGYLVWRKNRLINKKNPVNLPILTFDHSPMLQEKNALMIITD